MVNGKSILSFFGNDGRRQCGHSCCRCCQCQMVLGSGVRVGLIYAACLVVLIFGIRVILTVILTATLAALVILVGILRRSLLGAGKAFIHQGAVCNRLVGDNKSAQVFGLEGKGL